MVQMMPVHAFRSIPTRPAWGMKGPGWAARGAVVLTGLLLGLGLAGCGSPVPI